MKMYFAARANKVVWSVTGFLLAGLISLPLTAQAPAASATDPSSQQQSARSQGEAPAFYHLLYTLTESEGSKRLGVQTFILTVSSDRDAAPSELRVGSKIPIASGPKDSSNQQFTYVDVGLTIQARTQKPFPGGLELFSSVEQSSVAASTDDKIAQPVIRNSNLRDIAILRPNAPVSLGAFDVPGSSRHYEVQVTLQEIR